MNHGKERSKTEGQDAHDIGRFCVHGSYFHQFIFFGEVLLVELLMVSPCIQQSDSLERPDLEVPVPSLLL